MRNDFIAPLVIVDEAFRQTKQTKAEKVKAILERDFDEFKRIRAYVHKHMKYLEGKKVPIDVGSVQYLPSHDCVIINDLLLVSYTEAMEIIKKLKKEEKDG